MKYRHIATPNAPRRKKCDRLKYLDLTPFREIGAIKHNPQPSESVRRRVSTSDETKMSCAGATMGAARIERF